MADRYWVGASGSLWGNTSSWSDTSGGAPGASVPTSADSVFFDQAATLTVVLSGTLACLDFNVTAGTLTFSNIGTLAVSGSMTISNVTPTWTHSGTITFNATTAQTITTNGVSFNCPFTFNGVGGDWTFVDPLTITDKLFTLTNGAVHFGANTITAGLFDSSNGNVRTLDFGTGKFVLRWTGTTWNTLTITNLTVSGTPVVDVTYAGALAMTVRSGSFPEAVAPTFNFSGGTYNLTLSGSINDLDFTGFSGTLLGGSRTIYGSAVFSAGMTYAATGSILFFRATSPGKTVTTNGLTLDCPVTFAGIGGSYQLQDALTLGGTRTLSVTAGTLDLNGKTVTAGAFSGSGSSVRAVDMTDATAVILNSGNTWNMPASANCTVNAAGSTITMTSASAKNFIGGNFTYGTLNQGGAGQLSITNGSNTFQNITNTVQPATVQLLAGATQTLGNLTLSGTSGNLITLQSSSATPAIVSKASGTVDLSYVSIANITATGGATWNALTDNGNVDAGGNTGWNFVPPAVVTFFKAVFRPVFAQVFRPIV